MKTFSAKDSAIFVTLAGSHLYGTSTPTSDIDYRGVCVPPNHIHLSPFSNFEQSEGDYGDDSVLYGLRKYFNLAYDNNPNILELLFVAPNQAVKWTDAWDLVYQNRKLFLSKKIGQSFAGYALSQLYRIKQHREWFLNPPDHKPTREEFGLKDSPMIPSCHRDAMLKMPLEFFNETAKEELQKEREFNEAMVRWGKYFQWLTGRNAARRELESQHKYDTKHAMHLMRLISQAALLAVEGDMQFPLRNAEYLLSIRNGALTYEELIEKAEVGLKSVKQVIDESDLPMSPNVNALDNLYFTVLENCK